MNILALDDEQGALKLLSKAILAVQPDADLETFLEVGAALDYAREHKIDAAFLDIQMPVMTGVEVARKLKQLWPNVNVIFITGFADYAVEAMQLRSSGYLMKPVTKMDVQTELENLRYPVVDNGRIGEIRVKTFGPFDLIVDGKVVPFHRERAKELLACLVDVRGSLVTRKELAAIIFEDKEYTRTTQTYLTQIIQNLRKTLQDVGAEELLISEYNSYGVDTKKFTCDSYEYLDGHPDAINRFHGEYMSQYSWAEDRLFRFYS